MKYSFEEFEIDQATRELTSGGQVISVEPLVMDLLLHLVQNSARVVSKEELIDGVWQGRFISDSAVSSAIKAARQAIGDDGTHQRFLKTVHGRGFRFVADVRTGVVGPDTTSASELLEQEIRYCKSADGTRIAYAIAGSGPPLVKTSHWLTHLEFDWQSPVWIHINNALLENHTLIRFDQRGNGLSGRDVQDFSFERQVEDLEAVVAAAGVERFGLVGLSQAAAVSAAFAARHPEKVSKLVCLGGYERGWSHTQNTAVRIQIEAMIKILQVGWGSDTLAVQSMFTSTFMPDAPSEYQKWFSELQRKSATGKTAAALLKSLGKVDVSADLPKVQAETLVLHARNDAAISFRSGQDLAAGIPGARFVPLESKNHILPSTDPAWQRAAHLIREFLMTDP